MMKNLIVVVFCLICIIAACGFSSMSMGAGISDDPVIVQSRGQLQKYCGDENFSGVIKLGKDIELDGAGLTIAGSGTNSRHLAIDLNGYNITAFAGMETCLIGGDADIMIYDSRAKGGILFKKEDIKGGIGRAELVSYEEDCYDEGSFDDRKGNSLLHLEDISIECAGSDIEAAIHVFPGGTLELIDCSLKGVQIKNDCGNCLIEGCLIELSRNDSFAVKSIAAPSMLGSGSEIRWEEPWYDDDLKIKSSKIIVTGDRVVGVEFQGCSMCVEDSVISASGNGAEGVSYGESQFGNRQVSLPVLINSYVSGSSHAVIYNKKVGEPVAASDKHGFSHYEDKRIKLAGGYMGYNGKTLQTEEGTRVLYPIGGEMVSGFADVSPDSWYAQAVMSLSQQNIMGGTSGAYFSPDAKLSRGMAVTCIWRMENEPDAGNVANFADVPSDKYYAQAVRWAVSEGLVDGCDPEHFRPDDAVTCEQMATILYRYAKKKGKGMYEGWELQPGGVDKTAVSGWAYEAVSWMAMNEIIAENPNESFSPKEAAARAEFAVMLQGVRNAIGEYTDFEIAS